MKDEKATKQKLLVSAKAEFLQKGYMHASLRSICKDAGVTTGALYFFFQNKEDLFEAIVGEPFQKLLAMMQQHYAEELKQATVEPGMKSDFAEDYMAASEVIHYLYQNYDEFQLILTKSQGSRFDHVVDALVDDTEKHYRVYADSMCQHYKYQRIDDYLVHWIAHMHIDVFIHLLTHEESEERAQQHMKSIVQYLVGGWQNLFEPQIRK